MSTSLAWTLLVLAGLFETGWAVGLKCTGGFTRPWPTVATVTAMIISMGLLGVVAQRLPIGSAYAVWTGIGAVGTAFLGIWLFGESANALRLLFLAFIIVGVVGLKFSAQV